MLIKFVLSSKTNKEDSYVNTVFTRYKELKTRQNNMIIWNFPKVELFRVDDDPLPKTSEKRESKATGCQI